MHIVPLAIILSSAAVYAQQLPSEIVTLFNEAQKNSDQVQEYLKRVQIPDSTIESGARVDPLKLTETISVNGQQYTVTLDGTTQVNGRFNFTSVEDFSAEGAAVASGKFMISGLGDVSFYVAANGRISYAKNTLIAAGAVHTVETLANNKFILGANGFLTCDSKKLSCSQVDGTYAALIMSGWFNYEGSGSLQGAMDSNGKFTGTFNHDQNGKVIVLSNNTVVWQSNNAGTPGTTKTTTTASRKPTSTPTEESSAVSMGSSMLAAVAGVAALLF
jgi:hypothetical protein